MTLDGKIATYTGNSKWITGEASRKSVHELRKKYSAILVGINTVKQDNPMLNCRIEENVDPIRIICDTNLDIPIESNIVKTAKDIRTIVAYSNEPNNNKIEQLLSNKVELLKIPYNNGIDLKILMETLGKMQIDSVLIEGGGNINASALSAGIVNKVYAYIAPKIIGGKESLSPVTGKGIEYMKDSINLKNLSVEKIDEDVLITGYIK